MVWGGIILIYDYIIKHMYKKVKYYKIILIFMSSCFVTVILHFKDNFYHNLLYLFTYLLCFFVFYGMHAEKNIIEKEKEMMTLFKIIFLLTSLISFIGLIVTILKIQVKVFDYYWLGIYENRLIGIYTNSNLLALFCVISSIGVHIITASDSFKLDKRKKTLKIVYIIGTTINIISLILSDSNGSFIFFLIYFVVILFYYHIFDIKIKNESDLKDKYNIPILGVIPYYDEEIYKVEKRVKKNE